MTDPNKIDAKAVLIYLNQLGYTNISAHILKEFLTDLKKLIKSSIKKKSHLNSNVIDFTPIRNENEWKGPFNRNDFNFYSAIPQVNTNNGNIAQHQVPEKKPCHLSLHVLKKNDKIKHKHCIHVNETTESDSELNNKDSKPTVDNVTSESTSKTTLTTSNDALKSKSNISKKSLTSGRTVKTINRRDPVALYHYYQTEWKKVKFPGEEEHNALRRSIRKKLKDDQVIKKN